MLNAVQKARMCRVLTAGLTVCSLGLLAGCHTDMWIQPKIRPLQESDFFADGQSARPPVHGTVSRLQPGEEFHVGNPLYTGIKGKKLLDTPPFSITRADLLRGRERFDIYCSPCHGRLGDGKGMIAQRGLALRKPPGNYHTNRLRRAPIGHFYNVISNGFGVMYSYAARIEPMDRWRVAAYIRVLQISQNAKVEQVPADKIAELNAAPAEGTTGAQTAQPGAEH